MTQTTQLARVGRYVSQLLQDEYVQDQIREAITELRQGARRAKGQSATEAIADKKLRNQLSAAITALTSARQALSKPPPRRRPLGRVVLLALPVAAVIAWQRRSAQTS